MKNNDTALKMEGIAEAMAGDPVGDTGTRDDILAKLAEQAMF